MFQILWNDYTVLDPSYNIPGSRLIDGFRSQSLDKAPQLDVGLVQDRLTKKGDYLVHHPSGVIRIGVEIVG